MKRSHFNKAAKMNSVKVEVHSYSNQPGSFCEPSSAASMPRCTPGLPSSPLIIS